MNKGYGIVLNEWLFDDRIKKELRLLVYISSLTAKNGTCFASNEHFAKKFNEAQETISRRIKKLIDLGFISAEYEMYGSRVNKRILTIDLNVNRHCSNNQPTIDETVNRTVDETVKYNITSNNNTSIINEEKTKIDKFQFLELWNRSREHFKVSKKSNANMFPYQSINDLRDLTEIYTKEDFKTALKGLMKQQGGISKGLKSNIKHFLQPDHFERYLDAYNNKNFSLYDKEEEKGTKISL